MSFVSTGGFTKLSQLTIDADKDWQLKGISNIKELALAMLQGDILVHDGVRIIRLPAGVANLVLTSNGPLNVPSWQPGGLYLSRYFPASIYLTKALAVVAATHNINRAAPITSAHVQTTGDLPGSYVKELRPTITLPKTVGVVVANQTITKTPSIGRKFDLEIVVSGAVADDGGVLTNETAAAQSAAVNDMTLLPAAPVVGDAYDFGFDKLCDVMKLLTGIAGAGAGWVLTWKYWNGAWANLAGVVDGTNNFQAAAGFHEVTFTRPGDWALLVISGMNRYWIRAELTAFVSIVTQPKGTQAFIRIIT